MRAFAVALMLALLDIPAHGQSLQVNGKFGFLGEYELSASVTPDTVGSKQKFTGPMTIRHVGLCTHNGPNESRSEITVQVAGAKSPINATFAFDGQQCIYKGKASQEDVGVLVCSGDSVRVPFRIWFVSSSPQ
jgi:hypothetical protein